MDFRTELAKWGYNKGNSIDVDILVNEILPTLFSQQGKTYSEQEVTDLLATQRENCYVAILGETRNEEIATIALNAPEPGGRNGSWKNNKL